MPEAPSVNPHDWILIRTSPVPRTALVYLTTVQEGKQIAGVIYRDDQRQTVADDVCWVQDHWEFLRSGPTGTIAEAVPAAQPFIADFELGMNRK